MRKGHVVGWLLLLSYPSLINLRLLFILHILNQLLTSRLRLVGWEGILSTQLATIRHSLSRRMQLLSPIAKVHDCSSDVDRDVDVVAVLLHGGARPQLACPSHVT